MLKYRIEFNTVVVSHNPDHREPKKIKTTVFTEAQIVIVRSVLDILHTEAATVELTKTATTTKTLTNEQ